MSTYEPLAALAIRAAHAGGERLLRWFRDTRLEVHVKARNDLVTRADRETEEAIIAVIREACPRHRILAEEGGLDVPLEGSDFEWIIDPLDGTSNFVHGLPTWCVSIAVRHRRRVVAAVVYQPTTGDLWEATYGRGTRWGGEDLGERAGSLRRDGLDGAFLATGFPFRAHAALETYLEVFRSVFLEAQGVRRAGAAALDLAHVAAGIYDGFFEFALSPWDTAAGGLLIEEAGGVVSDTDGDDGWLASGNIVGGRPEVHARLLEHIQAATSEEEMRALLADQPAGEIERPA